MVSFAQVSGATGPTELCRVSTTSTCANILVYDHDYTTAIKHPQQANLTEEVAVEIRRAWSPAKSIDSTNDSVAIVREFAYETDANQGQVRVKDQSPVIEHELQQSIAQKHHDLERVDSIVARAQAKNLNEKASSGGDHDADVCGCKKCKKKSKKNKKDKTRGNTKQQAMFLIIAIPCLVFLQDGRA